MVNEALRRELLALRAEDLFVHPEHVNELRASVGLKPLGPVPPPGPELPRELRKEHECTQKWWRDWLASRGWRKP